MRIINFMLLFFFVATIAYSQEKILETTPEEVTVYLQSAKVVEKGSVALTKGKNIVTIANLSNYIDINTYQIGLSNDATLLSVTPGNNYLRGENFSPEEKELMDRRDDVNREIKFKDAEDKALEGELELIEENRKIGNNNEGWTTAQLSELAAFYANRIPEIRKKRILLQDEIQDLREEVNKVNLQLQEATSHKNENRQEVVLEIEADRNGTSTVEISYVVANAGWQPLYDIRASSLEDPISLVTKGRIYQNTGKDWDNVQMQVSTYLPKSNQDRPILNPFYVKQQVSYNEYDRLGSEVGGAVMKKSMMVNSMQVREKEEALSDVPVTQSRSRFCVSYRTKTKNRSVFTSKN